MGQSSAWQSHTTQTGGGEAEEILGTTPVPILEIIMEDGILDLMVAIILAQTMAMVAGIQDQIQVTTLVPILEIITEDGILDQMEAIIQVPAMEMVAGIQDLILATTLVPILEILIEDGIRIRIQAMGVEMAGIQGQIMEDGTLDGE